MHGTMSLKHKIALNFCRYMHNIEEYLENNWSGMLGRALSNICGQVLWTYDQQGSGTHPAYHPSNKVQNYLFLTP